jgi:hypothetical protein
MDPQRVDVKKTLNLMRTDSSTKLKPPPSGLETLKPRSASGGCFRNSGRTPKRARNRDRLMNVRHIARKNLEVARQDRPIGALPEACVQGGISHA